MRQSLCAFSSHRQMVAVGQVPLVGGPLVVDDDVAAALFLPRQLVAGVLFVLIKEKNVWMENQIKTNIYLNVIYPYAGCIKTILTLRVIRK